MPERPASRHFESSSSCSSSDSDLSSTSSASAPRLSMDSVAVQRSQVASVEILRCMRCARAVETTSTDDAATMGMVRISHNLYYCERCAKMVGYK